MLLLPPARVDNDGDCEMTGRDELRDQIRRLRQADENEIIDALAAEACISLDSRAAIQDDAIALIETIRNDRSPGLMEVFLRSMVCRPQRASP